MSGSKNCSSSWKNSGQQDAALVGEDFNRRMLEGLFALEDYQLTRYENMNALLVRRLD
jgi:hypothetical protein